MFCLDLMVDHALDPRFGAESIQRQVFRTLVLFNPRIRTQATVHNAAKWVEKMDPERLKTVSYDDFVNEVGDDGGYYNR